VSKSPKRLSLREQIHRQSDAILRWFRGRDAFDAPECTDQDVANALGITDPFEWNVMGQALDKLVSQKILTRQRDQTLRLTTGSVPGSDDKSPASPLSDRHGEGILARVEFTHSGLAYAKAEDSDLEWMVPQEHLRRALPGDLVRILPLNAVPSGKGKGRRSAQARSAGYGRDRAAVLRIEERFRTHFVGTVRRKGQRYFLEPDLKGFQGGLELLPSAQPLQGKTLPWDQAEGLKAVGAWMDWPESSPWPRVELAEWLGSPGEHFTEMAAIGVEFGFSLHFGAEALRQASLPGQLLSQEDLKGRRDFRGIPTMTIDPEDAKDFDDALSIRPLEEGRWEVGVHIADVSYYVRPGTELDREAASRATSVYMVHQVLPMLPENLSNIVCSLRPLEDKLCYSSVFEVDSDARIFSTWIGRTCIRSLRRFSYEEAQQVLDTGKGDWADELKILNRMANSMRERRFAAGSIGFETEEIRFHLDSQGFPTGVWVKERKPAHMLIEDWMLMANRAVAEHLTNAVNERRLTASVYRIHDFPDPERLRKLADFAEFMGYSLSVQSRSQIAASLNRLIEESEGKPESEILQQMAIRSMAKAIYTTRNIGHYGLAFSHYTHFTSPIRRYPDLLVHRLLSILDGSMMGRPIPYTEPELERLCKYDSEKERAAAMAERAAVRFKQLQMLQNKVDQVWDGMITSVGEQGVWVTLDYNRCDGLLALSSLDHDRFYFDAEEMALIGNSRNSRLAIGHRVQVRITRLDLRFRRLEFRLELSGMER
jgi:ribonuclease R